MRRGTLAELSEFVSVSKEKYNPASGINYDCIELEHIQKQTGILLGTIPSLEQASIKNRFQAEDTLFGKLRPNLRKFFLPSFAGVCSTEIWVLKADTKIIDKAFLFYLVQSEKFIEAAGKTTGSKMPRADWEILSATPFYLPPLPEQRKIATILRTWDEGIAVTGKLITAQQRRLSILTSSLIFGHLRLGNRRTAKRIRHNALTAPDEWVLHRVSDIAIERSTLNTQGVQYTVLSCSKHDGFVRSLEYFKKQVFSKNLAGYKIIRLGDFGFPSNHVEEGSIGLQSIEDIAIVSPIYIVFTPDTKQANADFLFRLFKTKTYAHLFRAATSSSVDRRGNLRWGEFSQLPLFLPSLPEQQEISNVLTEQQSIIERLKKYQTTLQSQKRGLMQKLLTGEWVVHSEQEAA
jgi:type I restriction enzyme S subunit